MKQNALVGTSDEGVLFELRNYGYEFWGINEVRNSLEVIIGREQNSEKSFVLFVTITSQSAARAHWYCNMSSKSFVG